MTMETTLKPTLFGYGLTTKAIAKSLGGGCTFFDDNAKEAYTDENNNQILPSHLFDPENSKLEVTTPSVPPAHPLIKSAKNLMSEYDFFAKEMPFSIWISGTNGKTTTTQMLTYLLEEKGAVSGGNIGTPLAELDTKVPIWVLESSSFTLHHTNVASPDIYLLLPITPDHLDWHGTPEQYEADKLKPLLTMKEGELALLPKGLNLPKTDAFVVEYDSAEFLANYFDIDASKIRFKAAFLEDALVALAVTKTLFDEIDYDRINAFTLDNHRQEETSDTLGRLWVNDSKATNLDATVQAVKTYDDRFIRLIIGGNDKGADLEPLFRLLQTKEVKLYSIGANSEKLANLANKYDVDFIACETLENAIKTIYNERTENDVALLSPAAASFDQFNSYKHRGEEFFRIIKSIR
ncbi:MAG: UDP-N-acetylmuramoylalanine--D-glutamate ligase (EC [uncultured Sulfurovum sp.]|uniref:UDP-N-acetylmuramoylalanine--D-glutamate ligase n=1 Tax=uncultured Sulfurovum sp. TaxID=269237 RepID=A0A6S6SXJ0_9BACT|nr:MAG: UDP-N-acetylmuramoylalanine--D-glutamate ligase (EC [uncultured Sulfurovum sp.]